MSKPNQELFELPSHITETINNCKGLGDREARAAASLLEAYAMALVLIGKHLKQEEPMEWWPADEQGEPLTLAEFVSGTLSPI